MDNNAPVFQKENYFIMLGGLLVLFIGFIVMSLDSEPYGFGALGLTIGPIIVLAGFIIQFFAIFYRPRKNESS